MKIIIDDQYKNDDNNQYTIDEDGNVNLFINIGNESEENDSINFNDNIKSNNIEEVIENEVIEFEGKESGGDSCIIEDTSGEGSTINSENPWKEEKYSRDYNNIYSQIEDNLEENYSRKNEVYDNKKDVIISQEQVRVPEEKGVIEVYSKLGSKEGIELKGARINLYLLNGVSPKLYDSKFSDGIGKVSFNNLPNGCYRIIAIVDRRFFEKPIYYNWNEVTIDSNNKHSSVVVVNKIKSGYYKR
ncbi:hypothetical protein [Clostridium nigeriense]|uniref:hypothetical protein n=1 Tax=Clostridium nigeriense TaxID=1805470 RepID=UPI000A0671D0|nr:hypothetical protein [Clostridium nigeriense]